MSILSYLIRFFQRQAKLDVEWRRGFVSLLEENPRARLLDVGCFQGDFTLVVAEKIGTRKIFGMDVLKEMREEIETKGIEYYDGDLNERLPFEDESFDVVSASQVIEHLSNTDFFVKEIRRVLVDGGYAVISTPNLATLYNIPLLMLGWQPLTAHVSDEAPWTGTWALLREKDKPFPMTWHKRAFTLRALEDLLQYHSFKVEKSVGSGFFPFPALFARLVCHIGKRYATIITLKVRKGTKE